MSEVKLEDPVTMCRTYAETQWTHGWVDKRKFKGRVLSKNTRGQLDSDFDNDEIAKAEVLHGWVLTVAGDTSGCGWDATMYFLKAEPHIVNGTWDGAVLYDDDDEEHPAEVIDGPHKATWLELGDDTLRAI